MRGKWVTLFEDSDLAALFLSQCVWHLQVPAAQAGVRAPWGPGDRIWSGADQLIRFPVLLLSRGPELYLYTSKTFEISVEFNSLCLLHQRKTPERFPHPQRDRAAQLSLLISFRCTRTWNTTMTLCVLNVCSGPKIYLDTWGTLRNVEMSVHYTL